MVNEISRREVLNNLIRFKDNLLEMRGEDRQRRQGEEREEGKGGKRTYKVLLNRRTGDWSTTFPARGVARSPSRTGKKSISSCSKMPPKIQPILKCETAITILLSLPISTLLLGGLRVKLSRF
jgi:hypothetical protein